MKKIENYNLIGYIQDGYLTINIYDISDDEISWAWSNEYSKYLHTSKLRYYPEYDEYFDMYKYLIARELPYMEKLSNKKLAELL